MCVIYHVGDENKERKQIKSPLKRVANGCGIEQLKGEIPSGQ